MHLTEAVAIATSSLWAHKLRSILTLIGVVIGVTSVIAVVSLINGANQYVATRVFRLSRKTSLLDGPDPPHPMGLFATAWKGSVSTHIVMSGVGPGFEFVRGE